MGSKKQGSSTTVVNQTTTPAATPEETRLNQLEIQRQEALMQPSLNLEKQGYSLVSQMLGGSTNLPGYFGQIAQGINLTPLDASQYKLQNPSQYEIGEDTINQMVSKSLQDLYPQFQNQGILDSGVAADIAAREALGIRTNVAQQNLATRLGINSDELNTALGIAQYNSGLQQTQQTSNVGNLLNLLNLGLSGQAQVQAPVINYQGLLSQRLAGLRPTTNQGTSTTTTYGAKKSPWSTVGAIGGGIAGSFAGNPMAGASIGSSLGGLF